MLDQHPHWSLTAFNTTALTLVTTTRAHPLYCHHCHHNSGSQTQIKLALTTISISLVFASLHVDYEPASLDSWLQVSVGSIPRAFALGSSGYSRHVLLTENHQSAIRWIQLYKLISSLCLWHIGWQLTGPSRSHSWAQSQPTGSKLCPPWSHEAWGGEWIYTEE